MKMMIQRFAILAAILIASCNSANPTKQKDYVPDDSAAGMTNTTDHGSGTTMNDSAGMINNPPNKSIVATDTSLNDARSHFADTGKKAK